MTDHSSVLLFDGVCSLCNHAVRFVLANRPHPSLRLASLQSRAARPLLQAAGLPDDYLASLVLVQDGQAYVGSEAALRTALLLGAPWPLVGRIGLRVPRALRDRVYDAIAQRRYAWFGTRDACRLPRPEERARFLSDGLAPVEVSQQ
jgi:predicted DCC family thiol-disulfide oxidoreductase YuxK